MSPEKANRAGRREFRVLAEIDPFLNKNGTRLSDRSVRTVDERRVEAEAWRAVRART
jgi:hypothetical protein